MKYLYIRLLSIILMIFVLIVPVLAQEVNTARKKSNFLIEGKVKDVATGEPLPFANISIKGTTSGTSSNVDGRFTLLNIPSDTCMLIISNIGYQTYYLRLTPQTKLNNIIIQLSSISNQLDEVVVTGEPDGAFQTNQKISMIKMTPANLGALPNIGERDILRAFQLMPGISAANENSAGLYVRGGTPDQSLVLYDGFTIYHVDHLFGFFSAFNPNAVKDVQLYKGGFESKFGGRLSSVAEVTGKEGNQKNFNLGGDISLLSANIFTEFPIGSKLSLLFAGRKSWKSPVYKKVFDKLSPDQTPAGPGGGTVTGGPPGGGPPPSRSSNESTVASFFYDLNGKITFKPTDKDVIALSLYNGTDKMDNTNNNNNFRGPNGGAINSKSVDLTKWGNSGISFKWSRQWTPTFYSNTLVSHSKYFSLRDRTTTRTDSSGSETGRSGLIEDNNLKDFSLKSDFEWKHAENYETDFGLNITQNEITYTYSQNDTSSIIDRNTKGVIYSAYVQQKIYFRNKEWMILPGIRYNYFDVTDQSYFEPRLSINYTVNPKLLLKAATGRYYQFAKRVIREDILEGSRDFWVLADGDRLPVASAVHIIAGASYEVGNYLLDVEAYYKELSGLSEYSLRFAPTSFGRPGAFSYEESFFQGSGETQGIDLLLQRTLGSLTGWVGYTVSETLYNFPVYSSQPYHAPQDVTHEFKVASVYKVKGWDLAFTWIYATGRPYTAPTGGYEVTLLDGSTRDYITVSTKNSLRLPDYHRLDVAVRYNWKGKRKGENSVGISVFNLYNRENVWYKTFEVSDDQLAETDVNFLGITPNISLSLNLR
jgi:ferric enterobactin receptor